MQIAVLMTNTDESAFAAAHPKDGQKFTAMIHSVRPDWQVTVFSVKDDEFPPEGARLAAKSGRNGPRFAKPDHRLTPHRGAYRAIFRIGCGSSGLTGRIKPLKTAGENRQPSDFS